jgi:hypothetical protein
VIALDEIIEQRAIAFFIYDDDGNIVHICKKKSPFKKVVDEELVEFLTDCKNNSQDPYKQGVPLGDNCGGYVVLKSKAQGYDVP